MNAHTNTPSDWGGKSTGPCGHRFYPMVDSGEDHPGACTEETSCAKDGDTAFCNFIYAQDPDATWYGSIKDSQVRLYKNDPKCEQNGGKGTCYTSYPVQSGSSDGECFYIEEGDTFSFECPVTDEQMVIYIAVGVALFGLIAAFVFWMFIYKPKQNAPTTMLDAKENGVEKKQSAML